MLMKMALAGGGGSQDSRMIDEVFANRVGSSGTVLYLPIAARGSYSLEPSLSWFKDTFSDLQIGSIEMWDELESHRVEELERYSGIYIGGGNTYSLLNDLRETGFDDGLKAYLKDGRPVYGGSAGAAILGRHIGTVAHMDTNSVELSDLTGLNMINGFAVWVHYTEKDDARIVEFAGRIDVSVLAISERSAIAVEDGTMRAVGFEPVYRFDRNGKMPL